MANINEFKSSNSSEFIAAGGLVHGYTVIPNQIMNDISRITSDGFTVLAKIFQYINNPEHKISVQGLATQTGLSKNRVSKALNKLIETGYIKRIPKKRGNLIAGYIYKVYDTPQKVEPIENTTSCRNPHFRDTDGSDIENRNRENKDANNTNTKKENTNNTNINNTTQSSVVVPNTNIELIEEKTHLKNMSANMKKKVMKWNTDRLLKAIDVFINQEGVYFSLLEKIYKDDKNFIPKNKLKSSKGQKNSPQAHIGAGNFTSNNFNDILKNPNLEEMLLKSQEGKF